MSWSDTFTIYRRMHYSGWKWINKVLISIIYTLSAKYFPHRTSSVFLLRSKSLQLSMHCTPLNDSYWNINLLYIGSVLYSIYCVILLYLALIVCDRIASHVSNMSIFWYVTVQYLLALRSSNIYDFELDIWQALKAPSGYDTCTMYQHLQYVGWKYINLNEKANLQPCIMDVFLECVKIFDCGYM